MYCLIWLDVNANNDELTKNELKSNTTCRLLTFDNLSTCEQYVFSNPNARFIFIVSYEFGSVITPTIASLKQTVTIIVYSKDRVENTHESWIDRHFVVCIAYKFLLRQEKFVFLFLENSTNCNRPNKIKNCS
jgi:hypothetical protein